MIDWNAITAQGTLFWVACGSVALGVVMIAAAAAAQVRRLGNPAGPADPQPEARTAAPIPAPAGPRTAAIPAAGPDPARRRLEELLDRLDLVAASLENLEPGEFAAGRPHDASPAERPLKEPGGGVEYVFRAAGG